MPFQHQKEETKQSDSNEVNKVNLRKNRIEEIVQAETKSEKQTLHEDLKQTRRAGSKVDHRPETIREDLSEMKDRNITKSTPEGSKLPNELVSRQTNDIVANLRNKKKTTVSGETKLPLKPKQQ